jgi:hypothetical protein
MLVSPVVLLLGFVAMLVSPAVFLLGFVAMLAALAPVVPLDSPVSIVTWFPW